MGLYDLKQLLLGASLFFVSACSHTPEPSAHPVFSFKSSNASSNEGAILYLINSGKTEQAIDAILAAQAQDPYFPLSHIIEELSLNILKTGIESKEPNDAILALYGIQISLNEKALSEVEGAIGSREPELQLTAVQVLSTYNHDATNQLLEEALRSDYLIIRLEAAHSLASKQTPSAYGQLEALMLKVDPEMRSFFPELFAIEKSPDSVQTLRRLLRDSNAKVRLEAIGAVTRAHLTELLPDLNTQAADLSPAIQEALAMSSAQFHDEALKPFLRQTTLSSYSTTALAAAFALYETGDKEAKQIIESEAQNNNLFAITLLGKMSSIPATILYEKVEAQDLQVSVNAAIALLERKDPRCLPALFDLFIQNHKDLIFEEVASPGRALSYYKITPSATQNIDKESIQFEMSLRIREQLLIKAVELPEPSFLQLAYTLFECRQLDLIPTLIRLLENIRTDGAIALLKDEASHLGSPFIRAYANLALFRLHEKGPYFDRVKEWLATNSSTEIMQLRPLVPWKLRSEKSPYALSLEERARLLTETCEALAETHDPESLKVLLLTMRNGKPQNRILLAGLLLRAAQ